MTSAGHAEVPRPADGLPGSARAAAAHPQWRTLTKSLLNGDVSIAHFNAAFRTSRDRGAYPLLVRVLFPVTDQDRASYPVAAESPRVAELRDIIGILAADNAVLTGSSADSSHWLFVLYSAGTGWLTEFETAIRAAAADHQVSIGVSRDQRWKVYRELCPKARHPARDAILVYTMLPLLGALGGVRYGPAWAAGSAAAMLAWLVPLQLNRRKLLSGQLAHPNLAAAASSYILATLFFPLAALIGHASAPAVTIAIAAGLGVLTTAIIWPAQRRFYARMRARAQLQA